MLLKLNLTSPEEHFRLIPNQEDVSDIKGFDLRNSSMQVLTNVTCETLPFLIYFRASWSGLTIVHENAFVNCDKLFKVQLNVNYLTHLPSRLFATNKDLSEVDLRNNRLTEIDENLFKNNKNLVKVDLEMNQLTSLPLNLFKNNAKLDYLDLNDNQLRELAFIDGMPVSHNLEVFELNNNNLTDLDVEKLAEKAPNLSIIDLTDNEIPCDRQRQLIQLLEAKNVSTVYIDYSIPYDWTPCFALKGLEDSQLFDI